MFRQLLVLALPAAMGVLVLTPVASAADYKEAPMLAERVAAGQLPPVEERLPDNPEVVIAHESVGKYGDEIRFGLAGSSDQEQITNWTGHNGLVQVDYDTNYSSTIPLLAESMDVSDDARVYTFKLRKGHKWSDGKPFTTADIAFYFEDILTHPDMAPIGAQWQPGGDMAKFTVIDEQTFVLEFAASYGDFPFELAHPELVPIAYYQKDYCSKAHPKYNENLAADLAANNLTSWRDYLIKLCGESRANTRWANVDRPSLDPWIITEAYTGGATQVVLERNPYFFQVDEAGQQLPYVDRLVGSIFADPQGLLLHAIGGNYDFGFRKLESASNRPALAEAAPRIGAELYEVTSIGGAFIWFQLNLTHKDPELRKLFNEKDFRIALSTGFDRQEVIDVTMLGEGVPWQGGPFEDSPMYHHQFSTQYLEFDPAGANALLDGLGLTERNSDGIRLMPSGRPVSFSVETTVARDDHVDQLEIMRSHWLEHIGVDMKISATERSLMFGKVESNDHDATAWDGNTSWLPGRPASELAPVDVGARYGIEWFQWYISDGASGEEPPQNVKQRLALWDKVPLATSFEERRAIIHEIAQNAADHFPHFSVSKLLSNYGIKKTAMRNVKPSNPSTSQYPPGIQRTWTFYWDTPDGNRPPSRLQ